jgi:hypothetical protein
VLLAVPGNGFWFSRSFQSGRPFGTCMTGSTAASHSRGNPCDRRGAREQRQPSLGLAHKTRWKVQTTWRLETIPEADPPVIQIERRMLISIRSMP